jgi:NADPH:quinone reductase-like Zn-dependent oxidoreductase
MTTMAAARFDRYGPPEVLALVDRPLPVPGPGEALVAVHAAGINPSDVKNVAGVFHAALPRVPGRDFAGVVLAGAGWEGREVWGSGAGFGVARDGTHATHLLVPLAWLAEKPAHLAMAEAASVGIPYLTAWSALVDAGRVQAGETVLITGALGAVGRAATQIARLRGARVIAAGRHPGETEAELFIGTRDLAAEARRATAGAGVDLVLDTVGGELFEPCLRSLRVGGRQVAIASPDPRRVTFDLIDFYHQALTLTGVDSLKLAGPAIAAIMTALAAGFASGRLRPPAVRTWPLARVAEAYAAAAGAGGVKQVLTPMAG